MAIAFVITTTLLSLRFSGLYYVPLWLALAPLMVPLVYVAWQGARKKK